MTTQILLVLAVVCLGASTSFGALGPYLVASVLARVLVAAGVVPALGTETLVVTALIDGCLVWSFFRAVAEEAPLRPGELEHAGDQVRVREQPVHAARVKERDRGAEPLWVLP